MAGFFKILFARSDVTHRYIMSIDGGAGLLYNVVLAFAVRLRGQALLLYHHSSNYVWSDSRLIRLLLKAAGGRAGHIMCSARMFSQFCRQYDVHAPSFVVNNAAWVPSQPVHISPRTGPVRLGHLSGLTEEKGLGRAIETLRELRHRGVTAELMLAGAAQDWAALRTIERAKKEFGEYLHCVGVAKGEKKTLFHESIDYFLFPSLYRHETQSLVVPEALAAGVPVIAYDHRYVGEMIGRGGHLLPAESPFAPGAVDWMLSGHLQERQVAARRQYDEMRNEVSSQIGILLDWARGEVPDQSVQT